MTNLSLQPFESFFVLRSLSPNESAIHLVNGTGSADTMLTELTAFVQSCLEVIGEDNIEITPLGEGRWSGIRVGISGTVLARQPIPRLHDALAAWMRHRYPGVDVVWKPR